MFNNIKLGVNPGVQQHKTRCEPRCSTTSKLCVNPGVQQHNTGCELRCSTTYLSNFFFLTIHWHYHDNYLFAQHLYPDWFCTQQRAIYTKVSQTIRISMVSSIWGRRYNWNIVESGVKHHNPNPIWGRLTLALLNYIICSVCHNHNSVLSPIMIYIRFCHDRWHYWCMHCLLFRSIWVNPGL